MNIKRSPLIGWIIGIATFAMAHFLAKGIFSLAPSRLVWAEQVTMKAVLILLSVGAIVYVLKSSLAEAGFRKPEIPLEKRRIILSGMVIGALATVLIFFTPAAGIPLVKQLNVLEFLLIIVIWSSIAEEVLVRGFVQTYLKPFEHKQVNLLSWTFSVPVFTCALLFSGIHLSLFFAGVDFFTIGITLFTTFLLGLLAGVYKEKYDSIIPSILTHMSFNVGAIFCGIILAITYKIITGELPPQ